MVMVRLILATDIGSCGSDSTTDVFDARSSFNPLGMRIDVAASGAVMPNRWFGLSVVSIVVPSDVVDFRRPSFDCRNVVIVPDGWVVCRDSPSPKVDA